METYTKINTLYKRYVFDGSECPNPKWLKFKNKIILGDFSNEEAKYLFNNQWEAYSKIDGTNSKIAFFPSTQDIMVGGKSDKASSLHGQFEHLQEIADRIKPIMCEMFPKECARFVPIKDKETNKVQYYSNGENTEKIEPRNGFCTVELEEVPIYIYGEYFGQGVQKCGSRYIKNGNKFLVFDIHQQGWWLPKNMRDELCNRLSLETVPFLGIMTLEEIEQKVIEGFETKFEGASDPTLMEEGIVARPIIPIFTSRGERIIVKVKCCDYIDYMRVRNEFTDDEFNEFNSWYHKNYK